MKRDMDLVRKILFAMEQDETNMRFDYERLPEVEGDREDVVYYHMQIMAQADLLHVNVQEIPTGNPNQPFSYTTYSISWNGHEFLDAARENTRWEKAKSTMERAGGVILPVLMQLLTSYVKTELKLP